MVDQAPISAIPSVTARVLAFVSIIVASVAGGAIGYALARVQCTGNCGVAFGIGILIGSVLTALGTSVLAVLALRAMGEWRRSTELNGPT